MLYDYYAFLMEDENNQIKEAYTKEFIGEFIAELENFGFLYTDPIKTEKLIYLLEKLKNFSSLADYVFKINTSIARLRSSLTSMKNILNGEKQESLYKISFPLLETNKDASLGNVSGILETITIRIGKKKDCDSFIYIPSPSKVDEQLDIQAKINFKIALDYTLSFGKKFSRYHEILIYFENKSAYYEGNSLGIALTIAFIEELTKFYNLPFHVNIKENIASTGGLDSFGNVLPVSASHIKMKIETVFYSSVEHFIIPIQDTDSAVERLQLLKETHPQRNLKLVPIRTFYDLLDRRSLIDIKKQPAIIRAGRSVWKNRIASLAVFMLVCVLSFFAMHDLDNNPAIIDFQSNTVLIKNKLGRLLFEKEMDVTLSNAMSSGAKNQFVRLIDIDKDGINEVLICKEKLTDSEKTTGFGSIFCYDNKGVKKWQYCSNDSVKTIVKTFKNTFVIGLIDTLTESRKTALYLFACDVLEFPSAIFKIDLLTGNRLGSALWNPGSIYSALIKDIDNDGQREIVVGCVNNALRCPCIFSVKTSNLYGMNYYTREYHLVGIEPSKLEHCLFLPKTDYSVYRKEDINAVVAGSLTDNTNENKLMLNVREGKEFELAHLVYKLSYDFKQTEIIVGANLRVRRDSLVARGLLPLPYTDTATNEYTNFLKSEILSWDGKIFTKGKIK